MSATKFAAFPTDFPSEAAAKIGQAVLARRFTLDLLEPAFDLLGYIVGKMLKGGANPVFGAGIDDDPDFGDAEASYSEDEVAHLLATADRPTFGDDPEGEPAKAVPWVLIFQLALTVLQRIIEKRKN